jgi:hypothetical protein
MLDDSTQCCECSLKAPDADLESTTLLSSLGWRVVRRITPAGAYVAEWRCGSCWKKYKAAAAPPPNSMARPTQVAPSPPAVAGRNTPRRF